MYGHAEGLASLSDAAARVSATPPSTTRGRRTHAQRSCLACRKRKVRCLLANTDVPSSRTPLPTRDACKRCNHMHVDCVVWDGDRRGTRYSRPSSSETTVAAVVPASKRARVSSPPQQAPLTVSASGEELLSPFYPFDPTFEASHSSSSGSTAPTPIGPQTPSTKSDKKRMYRLMRRPMLMLHVLLSRQDIFRVGVPGGGNIGGGRDAADAALAMMARQLAGRLSDVHLRIQHTHLPPLRKYVERFLLQRGRTSMAESLLLAVMLYLSGAIDDDDDHRLGHLIRFYARHILVRAPGRIEAAQALELMAVHLPYIMEGDDDDGEDGKGRTLVSDDDDSTAGASMMAIAMKIAASLADDDDDDDDGDARETRAALKVSVYCWYTALGFHDQHHSASEAPTEMLSHSMAVVAGGNKAATTAVEIGRRALYLRCLAVQRTATCEAALEQIRKQTTMADDDVRQRHMDVLDAYAEAMDDLEAERFTALEASLDGDECKHDARLAALVRCTFLCIETEAHGMHQSLLTRALADAHVRAQRELYGRDSTVPDPNVRIWEHPTWRDHVRDLGVRRNDDYAKTLARVCRLGGLAKQAAGAVLVPMTYLCAQLVCAAKALIDTQTVLLMAWKHVHRDTDSYVAVLHTLAETLQCGRLLDVTRVGACTAKLLAVIADTMTSWQDRQAVVLARARLARQQQATTTTTNGGGGEYDFFDSNTVLLDSLFDGIMEVPDWNSLMQSFDNNNGGNGNGV